MAASPQRPDLTSLPDQVLVRRATLGDRLAFAALVDRHGPGLFRYATTMLHGNVHDAEDAVAAAFAKAWQGLPGFRGEASIKTWLFRITANEALTARRRRRPIPIDDQLLEPQKAPEQHEPQRQYDVTELRQALQEALSELPWRQRACWILAEQEDMSYAQIATTLNTTETVVRGQLHRARCTLAIRLADWR